jgi:hypothetical protein
LTEISFGIKFPMLARRNPSRAQELLVFPSMEDLSERLRATGYIADPVATTTVYLAAELHKPVLLEGPVLGVLPNSRYESAKISLRQGDVLVLYTDGAVEAENPAGQQYSAERLSRTVSLHLHQSASELVETIYASVIQFRKTTSLADDLTLVLLKKL